MAFEYSDHTNVCTECLEWIVDHLLNCVDCAEEFMWTAVELVHEEGNLRWCDLGIDGTWMSVPRLGFAFPNVS